MDPQDYVEEQLDEPPAQEIHIPESVPVVGDYEVYQVEWITFTINFKFLVCPLGIPVYSRIFKICLPFRRLLVRLNLITLKQLRLAILLLRFSQNP